MIRPELRSANPVAQRFLMIKEAGQTEEISERDELIIVQNWFEELKRLVPTGTTRAP
ncbi:hypothetical protein MYX78_09650 [Acidobacteria bacterium AH-259-G07]|nr:hypothetical protein [Acidobacteria bacterium AH-259-G07]